MKAIGKNESKIYSMSDEDFRKLVANSLSYTKILQLLGLCTSGSGSRTCLKRRINELGIDISHFNPYIRMVKNTRHSLDDILNNKVEYTNSNHLRKRLIKEGVLKNECYQCGNTGEWLGVELSLQIHHKNGIKNDNQLSNLEILCPNCHSITDTYGSKNMDRDMLVKPKIQSTYDNKCVRCGKLTNNITYCSNYCRSLSDRKVVRPTRSELKQLIRIVSFTAIGKQFGVSDNAIRKWCKAEGLPYRSKDIFKYSDEEWNKI